MHAPTPKRLSLLLVLTLATCDIEEGGGYGSVAQDDAAKAVAEQYCGLKQACDCSTVAAECVADTTLLFESLFDEAEAAGLTYDAECMGDFLNDAEVIGCKTWSELEDLGPELWSLFSLELNTCKVFAGTAVAGEPCTDVGLLGDSCAQGYGCDLEVCDVAELPTYKQIGESCDPESWSEDCLQGFCTNSVDDPMTYTCVALPGEGDSCTDSQACAGEAWCDADDICKAPIVMGGPCDGSSKCQSGLFCSSNDGTGACVPKLAEGQPCDYGQCGDGLSCEALVEGGEGVCMVEVPITCGIHY